MAFPLRRTRACALTFVATLVAATLLLAALAGAAEAANRPPECYGTTMAVDPGGERTFTLRCRDHDYGPKPLLVEVVDAPGDGTVAILEGLRVRYAPADGHTGADSFTFRVSDGSGQTPAIVQNLEVTTDNLAPRCLALDLVATFVTYTSFENPCFDPNEGDPVRVTVSTPAQHGSVDVQGSSVNYSAGPYVGPDTFSLRASDGKVTGEPMESQVDAQARTAPVCDAIPAISLRTNHEKRVSLVCRDNARPEPGFFGYEVTDEPEHGQLDYDYNSIIYVPDHDFEGDDSFTFRATSSAAIGDPPTLDSEPVTVSFHVADDANTAPVCHAWSVMRLRAARTVNSLTGCSDADEDPVSVTVDPNPRHGALSQSQNGPFVSTLYTADDDYAGTDSYGVRGYDGRSQSELVTQHVRILGPEENTVPECTASAVRALQGRGTPVTLSCTDADRDTLDYEVVDGPSHGTIEAGSGPSPWGGIYYVYTPTAGYSGDDTLTYRATDGYGGVTVDHTILIDVAQPSPPQCGTPKPFQLRTDREAHVTAWCYDDAGPLDTELITPPQHGTVEEQATSGYAYTPAAGYTGTDSFEVKATNAHGSDTAVVTIEISDAANHVPQCHPNQPEPTTREAPIPLPLSCHDYEDDDVTYSLVADPQHGDVVFDDALDMATYTPDPGYTGYDEFKWRAHDGRGPSVPVRQRIRVRAIGDNATPRCSNRGTMTEPGVAVSLYVACRDADDDPMTIAVADPPDHGTITGPTNGVIVYTPDAGFRGIDEIGVTATDDKGATSPAGRYGIQVGQVAAPRCDSLSANVVKDTARQLTLRCVVWWGVPVAPQIADAPQHGTLSAIGGDGRVTYTPAPGFEGTDTFTYNATDSGVASEPVAVQLRVTAPETGGEAPPPPPPPPPAQEEGPPQLPGIPPGDPSEAAAEQRLGGDAVKAPGLTLGATNAFVPAGAGGGIFTVDAASEKLIALVCPTTCDVSAGQQIVLGGAGGRAAAAKPIRLRTQRLKLRAGQAGVVVLRLTKAQRRKLKRAKRATLKVSIAVKDARGKTVRDTARYRLRAK